MKTAHYISGGARSGKSRYALELALAHNTRAYLATAEPFDEEMEKRIRRHKEERKDRFTTIEEPLYLAKAIRTIASEFDVVLVDCLTVWLNNLMYHNDDVTLEMVEIQEFLELLENPPVNLVIVSNELGMGIVPGDALSREYRDIAGFLNQAVAQRVTDATVMVSGLPIVLKKMDITSSETYTGE